MGRLNRRIQRQDIGLKGNAFDHVDDVLDAARGLEDFLHGADHLGHRLAALDRQGGSRRGHRFGMVRRLGRLMHGRGDQLDRGCGLLQAGSGFFRAVGQVGIAAGNVA